jgi:iron(III) transport system ATP-binding protein
LASVSVRNLSKIFEGRDAPAVDNISFDVPDGQVLTLLGPSGCGKTTTLRLVAGLELPTQGEVMFGDRTVTSCTRNVFVPPEKRDAGMVFQSYAIWPHLTVHENVAYPLAIRHRPATEIRGKVQEMLELLGLTGLAEVSATRLSGGQQQRVAMARALIAQPALLLLDEPLSNLDATLRAQMRIELLHLQKQLEFTTMYVTHDQAEALVLSDSVLVMNQGTVQQVGTPRDIFHRPANRFVADFVGYGNELPGHVLESSDSQTLVRLGAEGPTLRVRSPARLPIGSAVFVRARPSGLRVARASEEPNGYLRGEVLSAAFMGEYVEYQVRWADGWRLSAHVPEEELADAPPRAGDAVVIRVDPSRAIALPA